jgi:hypothetical protein
VVLRGGGDAVSLDESQNCQFFKFFPRLFDLQTVRGERRQTTGRHTHTGTRGERSEDCNEPRPENLIGLGSAIAFGRGEKKEIKRTRGGENQGQGVCETQRYDTMPPPANSTDKHLFPAGMQKGREYVEVFSSSGSDPTSWWHVNQNHKQKISRHYNHELRSYYVSIGANCALPKAPQTLHLLQSKLIFQIMVPGVSQGFRANIM